MANLTDKLAEAKSLRSRAASIDTGRPGWWRGGTDLQGRLNRRARELHAEAMAELAARPLVWADA